MKFVGIILNNDRIMSQLNHNNNNNRKTMVMVLIHQHYVLQEMSFMMNVLGMKSLHVLVQVININIRNIVPMKVENFEEKKKIYIANIF